MTRLDKLLLIKMAKENTKPSQEEIVTILKFFRANPNPTDEQMHALAKKQGIDPHEWEEKVYWVLSQYANGKDIVNGGKGDTQPDSNVDAKQLAMGTKVEAEHTTNKELAKQIAKDHLVEISDYYTRLKKMEDGAKNKKEASDQLGRIEKLALIKLAVKAKQKKPGFFKRNAEILIPLGIGAGLVGTRLLLHRAINKAYEKAHSFNPEDFKFNFKWDRPDFKYKYEDFAKDFEGGSKKWDHDWKDMWDDTKNKYKGSYTYEPGHSTSGRGRSYYPPPPPSPPKKDPFETLGLHRNATQDEIKKRYRDLAKEFHPDVTKHPKDVAHNRMVEINGAIDKLRSQGKYADDLSINKYILLVKLGVI
jgi:hypothetical protein